MTGGIPSGPLVNEHLKWCPQCAELFQNAAALGRRLASSVRAAPRAGKSQLAVTEALIANERGVRAYLRSRSTRVRWTLSLLVPALLLARELMRKRAAWHELGTPRLLGGLLLVGLLGLVTRSALRPLPVERRAARLRSALAMVAWCLPCVLWFAPEAQAGAAELSGDFTLRSLSCFAYGSALAAPSFAMLWALDRGVRVSSQVWALAAGSVALLANSLLLLHCASTNRAHLMAGHFSIGLVWLVAVLLASRRADRAH